MRNKWRAWVTFRELEQQYGTFTAIAMMEDAAKIPSFCKDMRVPRHAIVVWACTSYEDLWRSLPGGHKCSG